MFSFRTTPIEQQDDRGLTTGRVGCFFTPAAFDPLDGSYPDGIFRKRGNLVRTFTPEPAELSGMPSHIQFSQEDIEGLDAIVVDVPDAGCRYAGYSRDVIRLLSVCARMENAPAVYVIDRPNPAGRAVEGTIPETGSDSWTPGAAHRHGLTLGELCSLYVSEIDAKFALHVISATLHPDPVRVPLAGDIPAADTVFFCTGGMLWNHTNVSAGLGTARPYEFLGAPWMKPEVFSEPPAPEGVVMRPCEFVPAAGLYAGELCRGYQILLTGSVPYHSLLHGLSLMGYLQERYPCFELSASLSDRISDPVIEEYLRGGITFDIVEEHVKAEEQKWVRKARRFLLYDESPHRMK